MNEIRVLLLVSVFVVIVIWVIRRDIKKDSQKTSSKLPSALTDEEVAAMKAKEILLESPTLGGGGWQTFNASELFRLFVTVADALSRLHEGDEKFTRTRLLLNTEEDCRRLSNWAITKIDDPRYNASDMDNLVAKSAEVARLIRIEAFDSVPKP